jgi:hypothetical protein
MTMIGAVALGNSGGGGCSLYDQPVERVAEWCPQLALARLMGVAMVPVTRLCQSQFSAAAPMVTADALWNDGRLDQFAVVDRVVFQIDEPSAWSGSQGKAEADFFFGLQSPVQATMVIKGTPGYTVAGVMTPIRLLVAVLADAWPQGWPLEPTQSAIMKFSASFAIPSLPATVSVLFRMWTPEACTQDFINMDRACARRILEKEFGIKRPCGPTTNAFGQT